VSANDSQHVYHSSPNPSCTWSCTSPPSIQPPADRFGDRHAHVASFSQAVRRGGCRHAGRCASAVPTGDGPCGWSTGWGRSTAPPRPRRGLCRGRWLSTRAPPAARPPRRGVRPGSSRWPLRPADRGRRSAFPAVAWSCGRRRRRPRDPIDAACRPPGAAVRRACSRGTGLAARLALPNRSAGRSVRAGNQGRARVVPGASWLPADGDRQPSDAEAPSRPQPHRRS
jgi:hypothetical protein